jgi:hypothetical protein
VKSIITYTRELKPQNLYPKRIISPPAPNKCCPTRMEILGRPRVDEHGRRFCYKRCRVCGFALRYFLEPVPSILVPPSPADAKSRKPPPVKVAPTPVHPPARERESRPSKPLSSRHDSRLSRGKPAPRRDHRAATVPRKSGARRRR